MFKNKPKGGNNSNDGWVSKIWQSPSMEYHSAIKMKKNTDTHYKINEP